MAGASVPDRGDVVWLQFNPQAGNEQAGRRPALVVSPRSYNGKVGLALVCPITSRVKGYPFEVEVPAVWRLAARFSATKSSASTGGRGKRPDSVRSPTTSWRRCRRGSWRSSIGGVTPDRAPNLSARLGLKQARRVC